MMKVKDLAIDQEVIKLKTTIRNYGKYSRSTK